MKKGFKKFLSSLLATVMVATGLTIGMTTGVMAADGDAFSVTADDFYSGVTPNSDTKVAPTTLQLTKSGATIVLKSGTNYYANYGDYNASVTNDTGKTWATEMRVGGGRTITVTPAANGTITLYWYDNGGSKNVTVGSNAAIDATNKVVTSDSATCSAGTDIVINLSASNICFLELEFTPAAKGTGSISGTVSGFTTAPTGTFTCGNNVFTVDENGSYSIGELTDGDYTLSYSGLDYTMEDVTVTISGGNAVIQDLTLTAIPTASNVAVNIANATTQTVTFTGATYGAEYTVDLVEGAGTIGTMLLDTYTVDITAGTLDKTEFVVTDNTTAFTATFTKAVAKTIDGPVAEITLANVAPKPEVDNYDLPEGEVFGDYFTSYGVRLRTSASSGVQVQSVDTRTFEFTTTTPLKMTLAFSSTGGGNVSDIAVRNVTTGEDVVYSSVTDTANKSLVADYLAAGTYRIYAPNTDEEIKDSEGNRTARDTRVKTIKFEAPTVAQITAKTNTAPAVLVDGGNFYVVSVITAADLSKASLTQNYGARELATTTTVYEAISVGGTNYTAESFGGNAGDYLFASVINNDSANATMISDIQANVTTVLS